MPVRNARLDGHGGAYIEAARQQVQSAGLKIALEVFWCYCPASGTTALPLPVGVGVWWEQQLSPEDPRSPRLSPLSSEHYRENLSSPPGSDSDGIPYRPIGVQSAQNRNWVDGRLKERGHL
jgi:hypothetical protein